MSHSCILVRIIISPFSLGISVRLLVLIFQGQFFLSFLSFFLPISTRGLQSPVLLLLSLCLFPSHTWLFSPHWRWLCLPAPLPYVHTLFSNLRSENAIMECLSIQLDRGDMLFLPISFAPFRRLNNVCVSGTSTLWDADGSHQYAKCVTRRTPSADGWWVSGGSRRGTLAAKMR